MAKKKRYNVFLKEYVRDVVLVLVHAHLVLLGKKDSREFKYHQWLMLQWNCEKLCSIKVCLKTVLQTNETPLQQAAVFR